MLLLLLMMHDLMTCNMMRRNEVSRQRRAVPLGESNPAVWTAGSEETLRLGLSPRC